MSLGGTYLWNCLEHEIRAIFFKKHSNSFLLCLFNILCNIQSSQNKKLSSHTRSSRPIVFFTCTSDASWVWGLLVLRSWLLPFFPTFTLQIDDSHDNLVSYQALGLSYNGPIDFIQPQSNHSPSLSSGRPSTVLPSHPSPHHSPMRWLWALFFLHWWRGKLFPTTITQTTIWWFINLIWFI